MNENFNEDSQIQKQELEIVDRPKKTILVRVNSASKESGEGGIDNQTQEGLGQSLIKDTDRVNDASTQEKDQNVLHLTNTQDRLIDIQNSLGSLVDQTDQNKHRKSNLIQTHNSLVQTSSRQNTPSLTSQHKSKSAISGTLVNTQ